MGKERPALTGQHFVKYGGAIGRCPTFDTICACPAGVPFPFLFPLESNLSKSAACLHGMSHNRSSPLAPRSLVADSSSWSLALYVIMPRQALCGC